MKHSFLDFAFVPKIAQTEALYFRAHDFQLSEHFLLAMRKGASVSFDTFFNGISISKLRKYTNITKLIFRFEIEGNFDFLQVRKLRFQFWACPLIPASCIRSLQQRQPAVS